MSQRDCGCPGLVTPTLDELLAVARQKPLPRVRIRERRPPPVKVGASLKGWLEWRLIDRRGREVRGGEQSNLITDQGLDQVASQVLVQQAHTSTSIPTYFPIIRYAAVGTDNTAPDPSDTALGNEVARTDTVFAPDSIARTAPGVYELTRSIEFDYSQANGNLTEWAFSFQAGAGGIFNRELFRDSGGDPEAVTKTDQEKLRLIYTLEVALTPTSYTAASFALAGVGPIDGVYTLIGNAAPNGTPFRGSAPDLKLFNWLAGATLQQSPNPGVGAIWASGVDRAGAAYADEIPVPTGSSEWTNVLEEERDVYTPGSFTRTGGLWRFETDRGNHDPVRSLLLVGASENAQGGASPTHRVGYVFNIDGGDAFEKDNEHVLLIGLPTVTWGRGGS